MCVLAGYIGDEQAAPILLEMLRKEEGLGGGYYTGVATIHEGKLHYEKVLGDVATLLASTDAADLPGTLGIAHSRTKSGGEREWAHPFVDEARKLAYVANGAMGFFKEKTDNVAAGDALVERGDTFLAASEAPIGDYPVLSNGACVHVSEIMCHQVSLRLVETGDLATGMARSFLDIPAEIVGLAIHADIPDRFVAARFNMPLVIARDDSGVYAASTALAFPDSVSWSVPMRPNAAASIHRDRIEIRAFDSPPVPVAPMPSIVALRETVLAALQAGEPQTLGSLCEATKDLWPPDALPQKAMAVYETLDSLRREGRVRFEEVRVPGQYDRGTVPQTRVHWVDRLP